MKLPALVTIFRDIALTVIGLGGIVHQELVGPVKWQLLVVYTTILGIPGAANIVAVLRSSAVSTATASPPSPSQPPSSSSPSASSSGSS